MPFPTLSASKLGQRLPWMLALPKIAIIALMLAVLSLLWMLHHNEVDEQRTALIGDVLWLEQNLRFHLVGNEEQLQQLATDLGQELDNTQMFRIRGSHILKTNPDLEQVLRLAPDRSVRESLPAPLPLEQLGTLLKSPSGRDWFTLARKLGKPTYSEPLFLDGRGVFLLVSPIFEGAHFTGYLLAIYSLDSLLRHWVPWWFAEKYQVRIVDDNGTQFAAKSSIRGTPSLSYELPLDPPGYGMKIEVFAYQIAGNPAQRLLAGIIVILAVGVFWSLWAIRDLMQRRLETEHALRAEHAFRKAMEDSLTVGMRARDLSGRIIYVNPAFCRMTGFSAEELIGHQLPMPYWAPEDMEEALARHREVMAGEASSDGFEIRLMRKNGERFQALIFEAPLIDGNGQHTGWMASFLDITERKRVEELNQQQQAKLQFSARLITMGEMASTLAHELNQPLAAIASYNAGCLNKLESGEFDVAQLRSALDKLGVQAQRAGKIIRRVHDFVRKSEPKRAPCRLEDVIDDCLSFIEAETRKTHTRIERQVEPGLPVIEADRLMLEQVLLNLTRNGMEAMADLPEGQRRLRLTLGRQEHALLVSVDDWGCGIPAEIHDRLFTAFFSTKNDGMGVGLSICRSIIEFHRGRIWIESNPDAPTGRGTRFCFTLPVETPA